MFTGRVPAWDGNSLDIGKRPDLACWMLAAHGRSGLRVRNEGQARETYGELWNEVDDNANQQVQTNTNPPRWSAKTPVFRWQFTRKSIVTEDRPRKTPRSRLQPRFVFFLEPRDVSSPRWGQPGSPPSPIWDHPHFEHLGQSQFHNAGAERHLPSAANEPRSDLAVVAAAMADWLAFQGFAAGTGSAGGGAEHEGDT